MNQPNAESLSPTPRAIPDPTVRCEGGPPPARVHPAPPLNHVDWVAVPLLLALGLAAQIALTGGLACLRAPLWCDEIISEMLVMDPSLLHMVCALKAGTDSNPPTLFLLMRIAAAVAGTSSEVILRSVPLLFGFLGLWGIYLTHRLVYHRLVALTAMASVWSHPLVVSQAFEARFYSPWLGAVIWFALALNLADRSRRVLVPNLLVALSSALVCTLHYFGVFSLALVVVAHSIFARRTPRAILLGLVPVAVGPVLLLLCIPFYLGQRAAVGYVTWVPPVTYRAFYHFSVSLLPVVTLVTVLVAYFGTLALARDGQVGSVSCQAEVHPLAGLASLVFMPLVIGAISLLLQPATLERYAIPVTAAVAPLVAPILARTDRTMLVGTLAILLLLSTIRLSTEVHKDRDMKTRLDSELRALASLGSAPVLFDSMGTLWMDWRYSPPDLRARWALLDPNDRSDRLSAMDAISQIMVPLYAHWYSTPKVVSIRTLRDAPVFYLFGLNAEEIDALRGRFIDLEFHNVSAELSIYQVRPRATDRERKEAISGDCSSVTGRFGFGPRNLAWDRAVRRVGSQLGVIERVRS